MTELIRAKEATITLIVDGVPMSTHDVRDLGIVRTIPDPDRHRGRESFDFTFETTGSAHTWTCLWNKIRYRRRNKIRQTARARKSRRGW